MGLMRPVANCDVNHNAEHGSATTANVYLPCSKTGIITSDDFCRCGREGEGDGRGTDSQSDRQRGRQRDRETESQRDRETERQT